MVNIDDFIKRLEIILDYYSLNASSFADKVGVQRSSMSHLLSGRNKPSLDFILKITSFFPDVDLYWLLNGDGIFPKDLQKKETQKLDIETPNLNPTPAPIDLFSQIQPIEEKKSVEKKVQQFGIPLENESNSEIEKIVLFYKNGTFKVYTPN